MTTIGNIPACSLLRAVHLRLDLHRTCLTVQVVAEAAPSPILWPHDQPTLHGIAVDVAKFLHELALTPDVEIVVASLSERVGRA